MLESSLGGTGASLFVDLMLMIGILIFQPGISGTVSLSPTYKAPPCSSNASLD